MVGVFVRLKLALVRNVVAAGPLGGFFYALTWVGGLLLAAIGFALLARVRVAPPDTGGPFLIVAFSAVFLTWLALPLTTGGGGDQAIDPSRLELLPLTAREKTLGLLAAAFVGVGPVASLLGSLGATVGFGRSAFAVAVAALAAGLVVVLSVVTSRAVAVALAAVLRSRRGRDLGLLATGLVATATYLLLPRVGGDVDEIVSMAPTPLTRLLGALPPGALAQAVVAARDGEVLGALARLAYGAAAVAAALGFWAWSLGREQVHGGGRSRVRAGATGLPLFPRSARWLPATATGATAAKELRYLLSRDPRQLQMLVFGAAVVGVTLWPVVVSRDPMLGQLAAPLVVVLLGAQTCGNQLGADADAVAQYHLAGARWRHVLGGKNLAIAVVVGGAAVATQTAVTMLLGGWSRLPGSLLCAAGVLGVVAGFGDVLSVRFAYPIARGDARPTGRQAGTAVAGVLGVFVSLGLSVPLILATAASDVFLGTNLPGALAALAAGAAVWWAGMRHGAGWAERNAPELLAKLRLGTT